MFCNISVNITNWCRKLQVPCIILLQFIVDCVIVLRLCAWPDNILCSMCSMCLRCVISRLEAVPVSAKQIHVLVKCFLCSFGLKMVVCLLCASWWPSVMCALVYACCLRPCMSFFYMSCASHISAYALMPLLNCCISRRPLYNVTQADIPYSSPGYFGE